MSDTSEYVQEVDEYDTPIYWNTITEEHSTVPVVDIKVLNYHQFMAMFLMAIASAAPKSSMAIMQNIWHPPIQKEFGIPASSGLRKNRPTKNDDDMVVFIQVRLITQRSPCCKWKDV